MQLEVDQSGRIEETNRDTVIALGNKNYQISIRISRKVKRQIQSYFKREGKPTLFAIRTFACSIALLIKKSKIKPQTLIIDIEYPGHEATIKDIILEVLKEKVEIDFRLIGKHSMAHTKAYYTFKKDLEDDFVATLEELEKLTLKKNQKSL